MANPNWFDVNYYLESKAAKDLPKDDGTQKTAEEVRAELAAAGYEGDEGVFAHYEAHGVSEGLYPSAELEGFDADLYLAAKAAHDAEVSGEPVKSVEELKAELAAANMSAIDHYLAYNESEGTNYVPNAEVAPEEGEDVSIIATALDTYDAAVDARDSALEEAELDDAAAAETAANDAATELNNLVTTFGLTLGAVDRTKSDDYNNAIIAEARNELTAEVTAAEGNANAALITAVESATATYEEAIAATAVVDEDWAGAMAAFEKANSSITVTDATGASLDTTVATYTGTIDLTDPDAMKGVDLITDGSNAIIIGNATTGAPELAEGVTFARADELLTAFKAYVDGINGMVEARGVLDEAIIDVLSDEGLVFDGSSTTSFTDNGTTATVSDAAVYFKGGNAYIYSATNKALYPADLTITVDNAGTATAAYVINSDNGGTTYDDTAAVEKAGYTAGAADMLVSDLASYEATLADDGVTVANGAVSAYPALAGSAADTLLTAQDKLAQFEEAVTAFNDADATADNIASLEDAVTEAYNAITAAPEDGLGLNLLAEAANVTFTANDDLYLVTNVAATIGKFGASGSDKIYFGKDFVSTDAWQQLEGEISENVGKADAFEIFYKEDGAGNLTLYVELSAAGGNVTSTADLVEITLSGVVAADVTFVDGFLVAGTASA